MQSGARRTGSRERELSNGALEGTACFMDRKVVAPRLVCLLLEFVK